MDCENFQERKDVGTQFKPVTVGKVHITLTHVGWGALWLILASHVHTRTFNCSVGIGCIYLRRCMCLQELCFACQADHSREDWYNVP